MREAYLAIDLGGGSGRVIAGFEEAGELQLDTVSRFPNRQVELGGRIYWDFLSLFEDMKRGIRQAAEKGYRIRSIGIDTWGVDFGLIDRNGRLLGNPVCYRDHRTDGLPERFFASHDAQAHYAACGTQVMPINTLFQLYSIKLENDPQLEAADRLLFMPDLFSYFLTGVANNEYTIASTSELMDIRTGQWNYPLIEELGLPTQIFGEIVLPGSHRGVLTPALMAELGIDYEVPVVAVASHDTASAVCAIPPAADGGCTAFLSSGTWSLLGVRTERPILSEEARRSGFTNEGGADGKICFLQNITGLWMLQRLMAVWKEQGLDTAYDRLIDEAEKADFDALIDVDDPRLVSPASMSDAIANCCRTSGQPVPHTRGELVRCVLRSLADRYRRAIEGLNALLPTPVERLRIIGGGAQNHFLNRLTAEATGLPVEAGPVEATAIGNILIQKQAHPLNQQSF
ncbi:MAG: rhamnulokinase family protein [Bacteroidaceae bacterium]